MLQNHCEDSQPTDIENKDGRGDRELTPWSGLPKQRRHPYRLVATVSLIVSSGFPSLAPSACHVELI